MGLFASAPRSTLHRRQTAIRWRDFPKGARVAISPRGMPIRSRLARIRRPTHRQSTPNLPRFARAPASAASASFLAARSTKKGPPVRRPFSVIAWKSDLLVLDGVVRLDVAGILGRRGVEGR